MSRDKKKSEGIEKKSEKLDAVIDASIPSESLPSSTPALEVRVPPVRGRKVQGRPDSADKGKQAEPAKRKILSTRRKKTAESESAGNPLRDELESIGAEPEQAEREHVIETVIPAVIPSGREESTYSDRADSTTTNKPDTSLQPPPSTALATTSMATSVKEFSLLTDDDLFLFNEGTHHSMHEKLGSHLVERDGVKGTHFAVWAPGARETSVVGDFNGWDANANRMTRRGQSGIWEAFIAGVGKGTVYKYKIVSDDGTYRVLKTDPYAIYMEVAPKTASIVWDMDYEWNDSEWMRKRKEKNGFGAPMSIYEVHLGSWRRVVDEGNRSLSYRELAQQLTQYVLSMNFTHVEFMPVMEHPFFGSWGYQQTGFFAPSSRYGSPQDFMYLVDELHKSGIGVILDWVPSHFPTDEHGLSYFDGTHLYEHADPRQGFHPDWNSLIFNYGRNEVRSFLLSSAVHWAKDFHADALRVDAVASMLYLDYSRKEGEWIPNEFGGRENLEAIRFLRRLNEDVYKAAGDVQMIAEESTSWPAVSRPTYIGGLGFGMKWDMGWMHDTLRYFSNDPIHRRFHHNSLTFRMLYSFTENFVLPLSHDEVVHGKASLLGKMPGDEWQKFANLRLLYGYMYAQPGKKLLFMGADLAQWREWAHDGQLDWELLGLPSHAGVQRWLSDLNLVYRNQKPLHEVDFEQSGFEWIDCCDTEQSIVTLLRRSKNGSVVAAAFNFTPIARHNYLVGVPRGGVWREILNSDASHYWGSGQGNMGQVEAAPIRSHGRSHSLNLTLPPLSAVFFAPDEDVEEAPK